MDHKYSDECTCDKCYATFHKALVKAMRGELGIDRNNKRIDGDKKTPDLDLAKAESTDGGGKETPDTASERGSRVRGHTRCGCL